MLKVDGTAGSATRIIDRAGNTVDGEWVNPVSFSDTNANIDVFPSGNGAVGGDFRFYITVLRGDVNRDGVANGADHFIITQNLGMSTGATWEQGDLTGNGSVGLTDLIAYQNYNGTDYRNWPTGMMMLSGGGESTAEQDRLEGLRFLRSLVASGSLTASEVDEVWRILGEA